MATLPGPWRRPSSFPRQRPATVRPAAYSIKLGGASSANYTIDYVNGMLTEEPYEPPDQSRYRAAVAFVMTLFDKIAGEAPLPLGFNYWLGRYLAHEPAMKITRGFAQSIKHRRGERRHPLMATPCALSATMPRRLRDEQPARPQSVPIHPPFASIIGDPRQSMPLNWPSIIV